MTKKKGTETPPAGRQVRMASFRSPFSEAVAIVFTWMEKGESAPRLLVRWYLTQADANAAMVRWGVAVNGSSRLLLPEGTSGG